MNTTTKTTVNPYATAESFETEMERSQRAAESAKRVARHARVAHMASAVHEHFGPGAKIIMKQEPSRHRQYGSRFQIEGVLGEELHEVGQLDAAIGYRARIEYEQEFSRFDGVAVLGFPDEEAPGAWRIPSRPAEDHLRPGMNLIESVTADDRDELDIRRQLTEMEIYPYRVDFDDAGKVSTWSGYRPCGSREDGLYDAEQAPEQTEAMQNVFDQHNDVTRTSLRWTRPEPGEPVSFKVA